MKSSMVAEFSLLMPSLLNTLNTVSNKIRISPLKERVSTYRTSYSNFSSQEMLLRPLIWASPVMMIVDTNHTEKEFGMIAEELALLGERIGVIIKCQKEEIFNQMHRI